MQVNCENHMFMGSIHILNISLDTYYSLMDRKND